MNEQLATLLVKVVQSRSRGSQDVVRVKADYIVEEPSEFVNLTLHLDIRS